MTEPVTVPGQRHRRFAAVILLGGKLSMTLAQGLILVVLARLEGAAAVGTYTLALAIVSPIFLMAHMRMQDVMATHPDERAQWGSHVWVLLITGTIAFGVATVVSLVWPAADLWKVVVPMSVAKIAESYAFTCHGYWQSRGYFMRVAVSNLLRAGSALVFVCVGTWLVDLPVGVALMAAASVLQLLLFESRSTPSARAGLGTVRSRAQLLVTLAPLGLVSMLHSLNQNIVRLMVGFHVGARELGVFAASAYLVRTGSIAAQSISQSNAPAIRAARVAKDGPGIFRLGMRAAATALAVGLALFVGALIAGPDIVALLYGEEFRPSLTLIALIFLAGVPLFGSTALSVANVATEQHRTLALMVAASLVVTAGAAAILAPAYGLDGAAGAWAIGETVKFIVLALFLRRATRSGATRVAVSPAERSET